MNFAKVRAAIKERISRSGLSPSVRFELLNGLLQFGQWLRENEAPRRFPNRQGLYEHVNGTVLGKVPIDYLEFGVYRGESIDYWRTINQHAQSRFWGFD